MRTLVALLTWMALAHAVAAHDFDWPAEQTVHRPGAIWWWMGSAVDEANLTANLEAMKTAGMGGVTIVPIYGAKGFEDRYIQHLSPPWVDAMSYTVREANRLGMWVDMTPGTGWPFGGPMVGDEDCDAKVVFENNELTYKFSGRWVKRAAPGGKGRAINPYSADALASYLEHFDRAFDRPDVLLPRAMYHDSFEFSGNWHRDLPKEFLRRRGYRLTDHLPTLFGTGSDEAIARVKSDYRQTLAELHLDYIRTLQRWAESKDRTVRNQAHGAPGNLLDLYAAAGIPETETFGTTRWQIPGVRLDEDNIAKDSPHPLVNRMASSAAHVVGRPLIASESCTWIRNHFRAALSQVRPEIDQLFLNGINHVLFHGTCYSPKDAAWPGWLFYASLQYNPRNAIWHDATYLNQYITRCQSILQSGRHDNDVAIYWPVFDIWHNPEGMQQQLTVHHTDWLVKSACGRVATQVMNLGYGFDFISDQQLQSEHAADYPTIVVPPTEHMPVATLKRLLELSASEQSVIFVDHLPNDVPGLHDLKRRQGELAALKQTRESQVIPADDLAKRLESTQSHREPLVDLGLAFIRRQHKSGRHYFIANLTSQPCDQWITLGTPLDSVLIMDADSGVVGLAAVRPGNQVLLQLQPGETRILRTFEDRTPEGPAWRYLRRRHENSSDEIGLVGPWQLDFLRGAPELPDARSHIQLGSWTAMQDAKLKRFAGTGRYQLEFELPSGVADDWMLDLGDVRESARVYVNDQHVAGLYRVPYRVAIGEFVKSGKNRLRIEVTNLSANRLRDLDKRGVEWKIFHDINIVNHHYKKLTPAQWPLTPSGLLGPVRLIPMKRVTARADR